MSRSKRIPDLREVYTVIVDCWALFKKEFPKWETADYWKEVNNPLQPWIELENKYATIAREGKPGAAVYHFAQYMCIAFTKMIDEAWQNYYREKFAGKIERGGDE